MARLFEFIARWRTVRRAARFKRVRDLAHQGLSAID